jgi:hypothetical protein
MQEDQIGPKIVRFAPADIAKTPTKIFLVANNLVCQLALRLLWTCHVLQGKSSIFYWYILLLVLRFLCDDVDDDADDENVRLSFDGKKPTLRRHCVIASLRLTFLPFLPFCLVTICTFADSSSVTCGVDIIFANFDENIGVFLKKNNDIIQVLKNMAVFCKKFNFFRPNCFAILFFKSQYRLPIERNFAFWEKII